MLRVVLVWFRPFAERPEPRGGAGRELGSWTVVASPDLSVSAQVRAGHAGLGETPAAPRSNPGSTKRAAQISSLPPEGTPVQTSPPESTTHRRGTPGTGAEPTSRWTVKSEGRDPLYGRRRLLAWPAERHPSSTPAYSAGGVGPGRTGQDERARTAGCPGHSTSRDRPGTHPARSCADDGPSPPVAAVAPVAPVAPVAGSDDLRRPGLSGGGRPGAAIDPGRRAMGGRTNHAPGDAVPRPVTVGPR